MPKHAFLSASASHRWLACPPSAKLCSDLSDQTSEYAQQGTDCHELCAYIVEHALGRESEDPTKNLTYYDSEMQECAEEYRDYVLEQYEKAKAYCSDPQILIEHDLNGGNSQMMCYALGALEVFDGIYDIQTIKMTIFQPRRENISSYTISKESLLEWADTVLAPTAELAYNGKGEFHAGDHCQFCKAKATCRKRSEYNLELAQYDFEMPPKLDEAEIAAILPRIDDLIAWANDIKEYALQQALSGTDYPGFKIVEGKSNRKFTDENAVAAVVTEAGFDPYEKKLLGITAMTSLLGKKRFNELLSGMITKPPGKPALVPESDKRPAMNTAKDDFIEE